MNAMSSLPTGRAVQPVLLQHSAATAFQHIRVQLPTSADNATLLAFAAERRAAAAAINRYLLPAGPGAANPLQQHASFDRWDRQTDRHRTIIQTLLHTI